MSYLLTHVSRLSRVSWSRLRLFTDYRLCGTVCGAQRVWHTPWVMRRSRCEPWYVHRVRPLVNQSEVSSIGSAILLPTTAMWYRLAGGEHQWHLWSRLIILVSLHPSSKFSGAYVCLQVSQNQTFIIVYESCRMWTIRFLTWERFVVRLLTRRICNIEYGEHVS